MPPPILTNSIYLTSKSPEPIDIEMPILIVAVRGTVAIIALAQLPVPTIPLAIPCEVNVALAISCEVDYGIKLRGIRNLGRARFSIRARVGQALALALPQGHWLVGTRFISASSIQTVGDLIALRRSAWSPELVQALCKFHGTCWRSLFCPSRQVLQW